MPNQTMASGIHAMGGIGRSTCSTRSVDRSTRGERPTATPSPIASAAAAVDPASTRARLTATCLASSPELRSTRNACATRTGEGIAGLVPSVAMPSPVRVAQAFLVLLSSGELARHVAVSLARVLAGSTAAAALAIGLGVAVGLSPRVERSTDLVLQVLRPIPPIAWIPLAIVWFGIGELSKLYIIFLGAFFPILVSVVAGIRQTEHRFVELARVLEIPRARQADVADEAGARD